MSHKRTDPGWNCSFFVSLSLIKRSVEQFSKRVKPRSDPPAPVPEEEDVFDFDAFSAREGMQEKLALSITREDSDEEEEPELHAVPITCRPSAAPPASKVAAPAHRPVVARPPPPPPRNCGDYAREVPNCRTPLELFLLFITNDTLMWIVTESNRYRRQNAEATGTDFSPLGLSDILCFLGIVLWMGISVKPSMKMYWQRQPGCLDPMVANHMARNKFMDTYHTIHFADKTKQLKRGAPNYDPLFLVRGLIDRVVPRFRILKEADENIVLDESMIPYKGAKYMRKYLPKKPHKYGYKVFLVCDSATGYCLNWNMYTSKDDPMIPHTLEDIATTYLGPFLGRNRRVFLDNWFTQHQVAATLLRNQTYLCGTIRNNRTNLKNDLQNPPNAARGAFKFAERGDLLYTCWRDKKDVLVISTGLDRLPNHQVIRWMEDPTWVEEPVLVPNPIYVYQLKYSGVDRHDQLRQAYPFAHKSKKWYWPIVHSLIETCIVNAHIAWNSTHPAQPLTLLNYQQKVATGLLAKADMHQRDPYVVLSLNHLHFRATAPGLERKCRWTDCTHRTTQYCPDCNLHLCESHYDPFHENLFMRSWFLPGCPVD